MSYYLQYDVMASNLGNHDVLKIIYIENHYKYKLYLILIFFQIIIELEHHAIRFNHGHIRIQQIHLRYNQIILSPDGFIECPILMGYDENGP